MLAAQGAQGAHDSLQPTVYNIGGKPTHQRWVCTVSMYQPGNLRRTATVHHRTVNQTDQLALVSVTGTFLPQRSHRATHGEITDLCRCVPRSGPRTASGRPPETPSSLPTPGPSGTCYGVFQSTLSSQRLIETIFGRAPRGRLRRKTENIRADDA